MPEPIPESLPPLTEQARMDALSDELKNPSSPQEFVGKEIEIKGNTATIVVDPQKSESAGKDEPSPAEEKIKPVGLGTDTPI